MQPKRGTVALLALTVVACGGGGSGGGVPAGVSTTGTTAPAQVSLGASSGLSYADFGYWNTPTGPANYYASGPLTAAAQLPPTGANITATYNGVYAESHTVYKNEGALEPAGSDTGGIQLSANFGTGNVSLIFTSGFLLEMFGINQAPNGPRFPNAQGSIGSTGGYTLSASNYSNLDPAFLGMNGAFYGPSSPSQAPLETAGTFSGRLGNILSVTQTGTPVYGSITGSFGAHR
jgi:hypothetical protein